MQLQKLGILNFWDSLHNPSAKGGQDDSPLGRNAHKKKLEYQHKNKIWEANIKISQYTPRKEEGTIIIPKVRILTRKITLKDIVEIYLKSDSIHVTREDTLPESELETKVALTRRRETKEDIMPTLQKMMNLPERESKKKVKTLQVMKNMF